MNNAQLPVEDFLIAVADGVQIECRQFPEPSRVKKQIETALILAHPYPPMGGDMDNNVVMALFEGLVDQFGDRVLVLAYNSRGAGRTTARCSWTGASEVQDVKALMDHLCKRHTSIKKFILCGYSYGAMILSGVLSDPEYASKVVGSVSVSFPLSVTWFLTFFNSSPFYERPARPIPQFWISGDSDQWTSRKSYEAHVRDQLAEPKQLEVIEGVDHFWFRHERTLVKHVLEFITTLV